MLNWNCNLIVRWREKVFKQLLIFCIENIKGWRRFFKSKMCVVCVCMQNDNIQNTQIVHSKLSALDLVTYCRCKILCNVCRMYAHWIVHNIYIEFYFQEKISFLKFGMQLKFNYTHCTLIHPHMLNVWTGHRNFKYCI